jgi:broad specificity phosphatase PhoE
MDIYLLRHGQSTANQLRLVCGAADYPLSDIGISQSQKACNSLDKIIFTRIYSSPLLRALQTIKSLTTTLPVNIAPELIELDTGEVSHITVDELWIQEPRYRNQGLNPLLHYPGGECLDDMLTRIRNWYQLESQAWSNKDIILISGHEGTVCGILHYLLSLDIVNYPTFTVANCEYVHVVVTADSQIRYSFVKN